MTFEEKGGLEKKKRKNSEKYVQAVEQHFGERREVPCVGRERSL